MDLANLGAEQAAKKLLGYVLIRDLEGTVIRARITETEAYAQNDPAAHSFRGVTPRTKTMFGKGGQAYVYFSYGNHYCFNVVTGPSGIGDAVLIRAVEIIEGKDIAKDNRQGKLPLSNGPGRLTQALKIGPEFNGHDLAKPPLHLVGGKIKVGEKVITTPRIGISKSKELPLRFLLVKAA